MRAVAAISEYGTGTEEMSHASGAMVAAARCDVLVRRVPEATGMLRGGRLRLTCWPTSPAVARVGNPRHPDRHARGRAVLPDSGPHSSRRRATWLPDLGRGGRKYRGSGGDTTRAKPRAIKRGESIPLTARGSTHRRCIMGFHDFELRASEIAKVRARRRWVVLSVALGRAVPIAAACVLVLIGLAILGAVLMR